MLRQRDRKLSSEPCSETTLLRREQLFSSIPSKMHDPSRHREPSIWRSTPLRSLIVAESLLRRGSGITTGSYREAGIERFNASSSSHRALVRFATTVLLSSWRSISLPILGEVTGSCTTVAGSPMPFLCSRSQFWGVYSAGLGCEHRLVLTVLWVTAARCSANLVLRAAVALHCFAPL